MTKGVEPDDSYIPVRDEKEEIAAIIELIGIANEAVKKPVFLAIGNDLGVLTSKVISALEEEEKITAIAGFNTFSHPPCTVIAGCIGAMRWVCGCVIGFPCSGYPTLGYRNGYAKLFHSRECNRHISSIDKVTFIVLF
jgi:hypothetical protein